MFRRWLGLAIASLVGSMVACVDAPRDTGNADLRTARQANQGAADSGDPFAVGICLRGSPGGPCVAVCSGSLIAPNLVLTARHCVDNHSSPGAELRCKTDNFTTRAYAPDQISVTTSPGMFLGTPVWHAVTSVTTPTPTEVCANDLALLQLTSNVAASEATPVSVLAFGSMADHTRYSTEFSIVGYGRTDPSDANTAGARHRLDHVDVECIVGDPTFTDSYCTSGGVEPAPEGGTTDQLDDAKNFRASYGGCPGDSGSGAFERWSLDRGEPMVMGVLARAGSEGSTCFALTYVRTDAWRAFLVAGAQTAATAGGYPLPAWASAETAPVHDPPDVGHGGAKADGGAIGEDGGAAGSAAKGAECIRSTDCASGACVALTASVPRCVDRCVNGACSAAGEVCATADGNEVCVPGESKTTTTPGTTSSSGCAVGRERGSSDGRAGDGLLVFTALALVSMRRRK